MGKIGRRVLVLGFFLATSAGLALPVTAAADPDPALSGDCASTLGADGGQALTLDGGAPARLPGALAIGTGRDSATDPAAHLDIAYAAKALHVGSVPGTDEVRVLCADAQGAVNNLSDTTQALLGDKPAPVPPPAGSPKPPVPPAPAAPGGPDSIGSVPGGSVQFLSFPLTATSPLSVSDLSSLIPPVVIPPGAEGANPPTGTRPSPLAQDSGSAQALPASSVTPAKLPLLLAAIALALAAAGLAHTWLRRTSA